MIDKKVIAQVIEKYINAPVNEQVIESFAQDLYDHFDLAFHFDDSFDNYVENDTQRPIFSKAEAAALDQILDRMWSYCDSKHIDIHELAGNVQQREFKKRGILPKDEELDENGYGQDNVGVSQVNMADGNDDNFMSEEIDLTEGGDIYDKMRENVKVGYKYYDNYTQTIFTVDDITVDGFVECTDVNDPNNKWTVDLVNFNRYLKMEAYERMESTPVNKKELVMEDDTQAEYDEFSVDMWNTLNQADNMSPEVKEWILIQCGITQNQYDDVEFAFDELKPDMVDVMMGKPEILGRIQNYIKSVNVPKTEVMLDEEDTSIDEISGGSIMDYLKVARQALAEGKIKNLMDLPLTAPEGYGGDKYFTMQMNDGTFDTVQVENDYVVLIQDIEGTSNLDNSDDISIDGFKRYLLNGDNEIKEADSNYMETPAGPSLFERKKPIGNEAEVNREYMIKGKKIKVVGIEAGIVRFREETAGKPAMYPKSIPLEKFNAILASDQMKAI